MVLLLTIKPGYQKSGRLDVGHTSIILQLFIGLLLIDFRSLSTVPQAAGPPPGVFEIIVSKRKIGIE